MFTSIKPEELKQNVFSAIGKQWMLITAEKDGKSNTMTASWGGLGVLWGKNVATIYVRPQRYTYEFVEGSDTFTLSFFPQEKHGVLEYCGAKSGRDVDKAKECGLTAAKAANDAPYWEEAELVLVCRKLYWQDIDPAHFVDASIDEKCYGTHDYHRMYIGEIVEVLKKEL
ncbi:MAG: flavin reductase family protein [Oscillospiraceae bacterium]|nr:flavin reductase family protein [Oscillospiraceae bacterium]